VLLAAGEWSTDAIAQGFSKAEKLKEEMDADRRARLIKLGFPVNDAAAVSALHTRNFM